MNSKARQASLILLIFAAAILAALALYWARPAPEQVTIEPTPLVIDVAIAKKQSLKVSVHSQGNVQPRIETALVTEVAGKVVAVSEKFEAGELVEKNEVLLQIDDRNYRAALSRAAAAVASAKSNYIQEKGRAAVAENDLKKYPRKHVSEEATQLARRVPQLEEAKAQLLSAEADLEKAKLDLERSTIRAPYQGIIKARQIDIGQYLTVGSALGSLFSVARAEIRLPIAADRLAYLNIPTPEGSTPNANVVLEDELGQQWQGQIVRSEAVVDERSRVLFLVAEVLDPYALKRSGPPLRMGSFVTASIGGKEFQELVVIPRHILRTGNKIWIIDENGQLSNRNVKMLRTEGEFVYVSEGLEEGERVCLSMIPNAVAGTQIKVNSEIPSTALIDKGSDELTAKSAKAVEANPS